MNRLVGVLAVLFIIAVAFSGTLGYVLVNRSPVTTTSVRTITVAASSNPVRLVTVTEEIIGVVTPQTATLTIIVSPASSPNCTIMIPTLNPAITYSNSTRYLLPSQVLNSTFSVVSTVTSFTQMPDEQTAFTTITESSNIEVKTTIVTSNSTIVTSTCPSYA